MKSSQSKTTVNAARLSLGLSATQEKPQEEKQSTVQAARASLFSAALPDSPKEEEERLKAMYLNPRTGQWEEYKQ
jgi:hypothetical protein